MTEEYQEEQNEENVDSSLDDDNEPSKKAKRKKPPKDEAHDKLDKHNLIVSVDELKTHLELEGITVGKGILEGYLLTAIEYCNKHNETTYTKENLPYTVRQAILLLAAHYFNQREATTDIAQKNIEFGVKALLNISRENITC